MQLQPLSDHVVLKPLSEDAVTKAGIVLPETVDKEKPERGEVIAVGPGKVLENGQRAVMEVKVGDTVIFKKYSPDEVKVEDQEYLLIREEDIMAIINS